MVAIRLFAKNGYHAASMRAIAKEAKIVPSSVYNHFKSKEAILLAILSLMENEIKNTFRTEPGNTLSLEKYLKNIEQSIVDHAEFWRFIHAIRMSEVILKIVQSRLEVLQQTIIRNLGKLLSRENKKSKKEDVLLFWASIDGIVAAYLLIENYPLKKVFKSLRKQLK